MHLLYQFPNHLQTVPVKSLKQTTLYFLELNLPKMRLYTRFIQLHLFTL